MHRTWPDVDSACAACSFKCRQFIPHPECFQILECLHRHSEESLRWVLTGDRKSICFICTTHLWPGGILWNIINNFEHETKFCGVEFVTKCSKILDLVFLLGVHILMFLLGMPILYSAFQQFHKHTLLFVAGSSEHLQILILIVQDT